MPISIVCPGCKTRFSVSEKFAGKQGPCPKCKTVITVPVPSTEEVKIHVPEDFASGGRDAKGRPALKPIARADTKFRPLLFAGVLLLLGAVFAAAWLIRGWPNKTPAILVGLAVLTPPLVVLGYSFLRDDELEAYTGRALWIRAALCSLAYAALWGLYWPLSSYLTGETWQWLFVAPVPIVAGALAAWAALDLDFGSGVLHYGLFLVITLLLRAALGLPPVWQSAIAAV